MFESFEQGQAGDYDHEVHSAETAVRHEVFEGPLGAPPSAFVQHLREQVRAEPTDSGLGLNHRRLADRYGTGDELGFANIAVSTRRRAIVTHTIEGSF